MDESAFETLADRMLADCLARIEATLADSVEVDFESGILTIELDDGRKYVINKHVPNLQIWLSSPVSGAAHFAYEPLSREWRSTRGGQHLTKRLAEELTDLTGTDIAFD